MDDGNITKTVKKHPVILRAAFLPGAIRNASGNGGGFLLGYMVVVSCLLSASQVYCVSERLSSRSKIPSIQKIEKQKRLQRGPTLNGMFTTKSLTLCYHLSKGRHIMVWVWNAVTLSTEFSFPES